MPNALKLMPPADAIKTLLDSLSPKHVGSEYVLSSRSSGRVLRENLYTSMKIPSRDIAAMDGYALRSEDVVTASATNPVRLKLVGKVYPTSRQPPTVEPEQAVFVACGAPIPFGADAVARLEHVRLVDGEIVVPIDIPKGKNISYAGEDVQAGLLFTEGHILRPQDVEVLVAIGRQKVRVSRKPRVAIISTGNELAKKPSKTKVACSRAYNISSLVAAMGGEPIFLGVARDDLVHTRTMILEGVRRADVVLTIAGVSVGEKDLVMEAIQSIRGSQIIAHGLSIHPGRPLSLSVIRGKAVVSLPGHVASTNAAFYLTVPRTLRCITGARGVPWPQIKARLTEGFKSGPLNELVRVRITKRQDGYWAEPFRGQITMLTSMTRTNGFFIAPPKETLEAGDEVDVLLYSPLEFSHLGCDEPQSDRLTWF